jgi:hypothetical protein
MKLDLKSRDEFMAVWNALQQFIDNNDETEWSDDVTDTELRRQRDAAIALRDKFEVAIAATAN